MASPRPGFFPRAINLGLVIGSTLIGLFVVEIGYRALAGVPLFRPANWRVERVVVGRLLDRTVVDPVLGWTVRSNYRSTEHNTLDYGIRRNFDEAGLRRGAVLAVGDSFTEGWEVDDNESWPAYLERLLEQPVVNGGVGGYGTDQIVLRTEQLLPVIAPTTLIVGFLDFDIVRTAHSHFAAPKPWFSLEGGMLHYHPPAPLEAGRALGDLGALARRMRDVLGYSAAADHVLARVAPGYWYSEGQGDYRLAGNDSVAVTCALLGRLKRQTDAQGIRLLLFMQYYAWFVYAADLRPPDASRVLDCARAQGIETVDHFASLRRIAVSGPRALADYYMTHGDLHTHMNARGNQHAAELLARAIRHEP
jgi:hypothetical protein